MKLNLKKSGELFHRDEAGVLHLNIYYGCDLVCPYCYWQAEADWVDQITVYTDVVERLQEEVVNLPKNTKIGLGWKGNPYTSIEQEYGLTRRCLEILLSTEMDVTLSASRCNDIILRDMDLLLAHRDRVRVIIELSRLDLLREFNETGDHVSLRVANELHKNGISICTTVSPVLPGISDVEKIAAALPGIPVHIAKLDIRPGTLWNEKTLAYIHKNYPNLLPQYEEIARTGTDPYFESLKKKCGENSQLRAELPFFDEIPEI